MNPYQTSLNPLQPNPAINNQTVVSPIIQVQPSNQNDTMQQMMQMMQMQAMMQMQMQQMNNQKPQSIVVNTTSNNTNNNTNSNINTNNNTNGTECSHCGMLTGNYARRVHGKCSLIWCLSLTLLTGGLIFCVGSNHF